MNKLFYGAWTSENGGWIWVCKNGTVLTIDKRNQLVFHNTSKDQPILPIPNEVVQILVECFQLRKSLSNNQQHRIITRLNRQLDIERGAELAAPDGWRCNLADRSWLKEQLVEFEGKTLLIQLSTGFRDGNYLWNVFGKEHLPGAFTSGYEGRVFGHGQAPTMLDAIELAETFYQLFFKPETTDV